MVRLVDSHCHINFDPLGEETEAVLRRAQEQGVGHMLCVSVNLEDYPQVRELARAHDNVFASVGVHPNEREGRDPTSEELVDLAQDPSVVAIGETGLDYFRSEEAMDWQHDRFRNHIRAAIAAKKPLIIHTRDAASDTMKLLREESARDAGGVMHCFVEDWDIATQALDIGFYISFSGIVTFKNADELREVARKVPRDRILVETDSPYLAPVPYRGKTNEPSYVRYVAETLADLRDEDLEEFCGQTTDNFFRLFSDAVPVS